MGLYARWIENWEHQLATRDTNRVVRDFEWGPEWLGIENANGDVADRVRDAAAQALAGSDQFFSYEPRRRYRLIDNHLTFTSAIETPHPENNRVHADYFPAEGRPGRAVVVLPQWNADAGGHLGLCKLLNRFGISALRMSLAYHDRRMPMELERADYHVSANVGRTIQATRQSIIDARCCLDWLGSQGHERLGILGTSLGSCVAFIVAAHDTRLCAGVFNHVSMHFSDVVWTGLSTRHVRLGFEKGITQDELRRYWAVISPASYLDRLCGRDLRSLLVWGRYDSTFLPIYSQQVVEGFRERGLPHEVLTLPCGHYTTGQFPFNLMDGFRMCGFLRRNL